MTGFTPRWLRPRECPGAARVLHSAFGGHYVRHLVHVVVTPHLTVSGHAALLGVGPDHGRRAWGRRVLDSVIHVAWTLTAATTDGESVPWVLRSSYVPGWRLVNLAKDPARRSAAPAVVAMFGHMTALADRTGMDMVARVDVTAPRLTTAYLRRGFRITRSDTDEHLLYRPARTPAPDRGWRSVLRTGRLTKAVWEARFGPVHAPFLDVGAGDSPLGADLVTAGLLALAVDPQYTLRSRGGNTVAAVAEHLPFRDGTFTTVNANFVMQHVTRPRRVLSECLRVTRDGGTLVLHPVWAPRPYRTRLNRVPGVRILPGRALPPGRQRPSMTLRAGTFDPAAHGAEVVAALRPHPVVVWLGRLAMRIVIASGKDGRNGP